MGPYADVFAAFDRANIRYVVVGGTAVVLQGHARMTVDLDLVIDLAQEEALRAVDVLLSLGLLPRLPVPAQDFADARKRREWIDTKNLQVFSFYDPTNPLLEVDVFADYPLDFTALLRDASLVDLEGVAVPVASIAHLILMKEQAGRSQDTADVAALRALSGEASDG